MVKRFFLLLTYGTTYQPLGIPQDLGLGKKTNYNFKHSKVVGVIQEKKQSQINDFMKSFEGLEKSSWLIIYIIYGYVHLLL